MKSLIFDMDDTLYNEIEFVFSGFKAVDDWLIKNWNQKGFYKIAINIFLNGEKKFVFNQALDYLGIEYSSSQIDEMVNVYRNHLPEITILEEFIALQKKIYPWVKLGVITDGYLATQKNKANSLRLKKYFQTIVFTDEYGKKFWKPHRLPYDVICKEFRCNHEDCIYVGDNINKDFITAKRLGWRTIQVIREESIYKNQIVEEQYKAHHIIKDLREIAEIKEIKDLFCT
ncbi:HAD family hydrolase [Sutcliffiella sp. BMC8]|uniref:HAD family hydrolase n=1 Tax=Sutcliffiella sp. BMC8 TaxID=3073243 RepID=UPI0030D3D076